MTYNFRGSTVISKSYYTGDITTTPFFNAKTFIFYLVCGNLPVIPNDGSWGCIPFVNTKPQYAGYNETCITRCPKDYVNVHEFHNFCSDEEKYKQIVIYNNTVDSGPILQWSIPNGTIQEHLQDICVHPNQCKNFLC